MGGTRLDARRGGRHARDLVTVPPDAPPPRRRARWILLVPVAILVLAGARWLMQDGAEAPRRTGGAAPVEVAPVRIGAIAAVRELTGTLEPSAQAIVAAELAGTVLEVHAVLADQVAPEEILAVIDDREARQIAAAARASLAVARARVRAAESVLATAQRARGRSEALGERGIASDTSRETAQAAVTEAEAALAVAQAEVARAQADASAARLQVERARVRGRWSDDAGPRRVAERAVDEGARVAVGDALFTLVDVDPLLLVVRVTPEDYAGIAPGQSVTLRAAGGAEAEGTVARIAPGFDAESRQARVEIEVANPDGALRPGTFVRSQAVLRTLEDATLIPEEALTRRDGQDVVFVVDGETARMVPVTIRLRAGGEVAVEAAPGLEGQVVTLGQQRLDEGAAVRIAGTREPGDTADADEEPAE